MQTRSLPFTTVPLPAKRICTALAAVAMLLSAAGCSTPRVAGRAEAERQQSPCEQSYFMAKEDDATSSDPSRHIIMRYIAATHAASEWLDTAAYCPARFADGTLRAARARVEARALASAMGVTVETPALARFDGVDSLAVDKRSLTSLADAEDQAGFIMEVFAARSIGHATLDISDRHKTAAQRLASFSGSDTSRAKAYEIADLLANPSTMTDSATGLNAPTDAIVEINCARGEITTVSESSSTSDSGESASKDSRAQSLKTLSSAIADRVETAFSWGYPTFDGALFE